MYCTDVVLDTPPLDYSPCTLPATAPQRELLIMASLLQTSASEGADILSKLSTVCHNKYQCPPLSPAYVQGSKAVILLRGTKAGEPIGVHCVVVLRLLAGHGVLGAAAGRGRRLAWWRQRRRRLAAGTCQSVALHGASCTPCTAAAGLGVGFRSGHGILLAHLPAHHPSEPPRWSAPVFLKVRARRTAAWKAPAGMLPSCRCCCWRQRLFASALPLRALRGTCIVPPA